MWSLLALYLLLMLVTRLAPCQRYLGRQAAVLLSQKLGTGVQVGRIDLGFLNRVIIDDLTLYDQQGRKMLTVARASARFDILPLTEGRISISAAQLFGAHARLYRPTAASPANFQFVIDSLASKDTTASAPLDLAVNSLIMSRSSISYDQLDAPPTPSLFNPRHLHITSLSAHVALKRLTADSINIELRRMAVSEATGLDIRKAQLALRAGRHGAQLRHLRFDMPGSRLQIDTLNAGYQMHNGEIIPASLTYEGAITESYITPSDLRCFHNPLKNVQKAVHIEARGHGDGRQTVIPSLRLFTDAGDINVEGNGTISYYDRLTGWHAAIQDVTLSESIIDFLHKNIAGLPDLITRIGNLNMKGEIDRTADGTLKAHASLTTNIGSATAGFLMHPSRQFEGTVDTEDMQLGTLLDDAALGLLAANISFDGSIDAANRPSVSARGVVSRLEYNGYPFTGIGLNGTYSDEGVAGYLKVEDPNLQTELEGSVRHGQGAGSPRAITLSGQVSRLAPQALLLSDRWGDAVFSGQLQADLTARDINDAKGFVTVSNFTMRQHHQPDFRIDSVRVTSGFGSDHHFLTLASDFARAELKGQFEYNTLAQSLVNFISTALPTLPGLPPVTEKTRNDFALRLRVLKTDWLQRLLGIDVSIGRPLAIDATVNDHTRTITLDGSLPDIVYEGAAYRRGTVHLTSPADTIKCDVAFDKLMDDGQLMRVTLNAAAIHNLLTTSLAWDNLQATANNSGRLNLITTLYRNLDAKPEAQIRVQPSHIILNDSVWSVEPADITYADRNLLVDHFIVHNGPQHILIDGRATDSDRDALTADLKGVEVAYILDLVNFHSVEFSGQASGKATARAIFGDFKGDADLTVDNFKFERGRMGTLQARASYNARHEQIDIDATASDGDAATIIWGYVSPARNDIDLSIESRGTYIDFMHNFTSSFLSSITGHAYGRVRLAGALDDLNLTGQIVIPEGEAAVAPLNTVYTFRNDTITLVPDDIRFSDMPLYDKYGNQATLSGAIHHESLTNLTFDLFVNADNLLAYDHRSFGESAFYGTVFASGNVGIHGKRGEVVIDCAVTPQKNSVFVYNASSPDAISNQEFIEWGSASRQSDAPGAGLTADEVTPPAREEDIDIPTDIYINFLINCTPDATLRLLMDAAANDYITLNGDGTIRAAYYNKGPFNMFGTYTVSHGTYGVTIQNIIKKNFTFNPGGTIVFGGDPYNAALNLQAVYTVNGVSLSDLNIGNSFASNTIRVNCLMNIGGQPSAPQVEFDLEMPTVNADEQQMVRSIINGQQEMNQQVLYLLGIGRFYNQGQNNAGAGQSDRTSLAMQSFLSGTLSTQINTLLSSVIKNENWNFGANISTGNEGWHNAEYEGLISGRMLNNRLLLNGQFGYRDNAKQAAPSFIGDFDIQYLLFPNGNLALKVYNQTNDRYFTKSSLNTQGIGLIMKKDFKTLRDLFSTSRKKKKDRKEKNKENKE